jgi:limonene 1,2-monooxygenase
MEERAAHYGVKVDRNAWRLVGLVHLAETREQAYKDVEHGMLDWFDYFQHTAAFPQMAVGDGTTVRQCIDFVNQSGLGTIGTPEDAVAQIERLVKQSNGGFGAYLQLAHDWAAPAAKLRSYELFARHVAPVVNAANRRRSESLAFYNENKRELMGKAGNAMRETFERHKGEIAQALKTKKQAEDSGSSS